MKKTINESTVKDIQYLLTNLQNEFDELTKGRFDDKALLETIAANLNLIQDAVRDALKDLEIKGQRNAKTQL
jgi:hypothetical protein